MQNNNIKEDLEKIYSDVSEWLKFAEAKHAALIALWTAFIAAAFSSDIFLNLTRAWQSGVIFVLSLGMVINILALMPFTNKNKLLRKTCYDSYKDASENLIFYKSIFIAVGSPEDSLDNKVDKYKDILKNEYGSVPQGSLITDYIKQIIDVATIASIKTYLFSISTIYLLVILFLSLICFILG